MGTRLATPDTAKKHQEHTVFRYFVSSIYRVKEKRIGGIIFGLILV